MCPSARRQGYYIESCARMRYKAEFAPCDLLCSRAGAWLPFARVAAALRADPGCVLSQVRARARRACSFPGSAWVPRRSGPPQLKRFLWPSDGRAGLPSQQP